ncbi:MAG TPA: S49 family peptidase, partial [Polyangiaceae bacterium]|nr:S49 family peptidase [Polyangiaceae bacterium]
ASAAGSIGVIDSMVDQTKADRQMGFQWTLLTTGQRKADGNPHTSPSEETIAARQGVIDSMASTFFELVASARGLSTKAVKSLEAAVFTAEQAKDVGLVDSIMTLDELLAMLAGSDDPNDGAEKSTMSYKEAIASLRKAAEGDDEEAKKAKKALAALEDDEKKESKADGESDDDKEKESKASAEGDDPDKEKEAAAARSTSAPAALTAEGVAKIVGAELSKARAIEAESSERTLLISQRPDLSESARKALAAVPIEQLRVLVKETPRGQSPVAAARAAIETGSPTLGSTAHTPVTAQHPDAKAAMDLQMGLGRFKAGIKEEENRLVLGALVPLTGKEA